MKWFRLVARQIVLVIGIMPFFAWGGTPDYAREAVLLDNLRSAADQYGSRSFETASHRLDLADYYLSVGEFPKAEPLLYQSLGLLQKEFGKDTVKLIPVLEKLASLDLRQKRFPFALSLYSQALSIAGRSYGQQSEITKNIAESIAETRRAEREWERFGSRQTFVANDQVASPPLVGGTVVTAPTGRSMTVATSSPNVVQIQSPAGSPTVLSNTTQGTQPVVVSVGGKGSFLPPAVSRVERETPPVREQVMASTTPAYLDRGNRAEAASEVPHEPPAEQKRGYFIAMGCFSDREFAVNQAKRVMSLSLPVYMKSIRDNSLHCTFGGPFASEQEAEAGATRAREQAKVADTFVRKYQ